MVLWLFFERTEKNRQLEEMAMAVVDLVDRDKDRVHHQVQRQNNRQQITTLIWCSLFTNPNMLSWHCRQRTNFEDGIDTATSKKRVGPCTKII